MYSGQKRHFVFLYCLFIIIGVLRIITGFSMGMLTQTAIFKIFPEFYTYVEVYMSVSIISAIIEYIANKYQVNILEKSKAAFRVRIADAILHMDFATSQHLRSGDLIGRISGDIESMGKVINLSATLLKSITLSILLVISLFKMNIQIGIAFVLPLPLLYLANKQSEKMSSSVIAWRKAYAEMNSRTQDILRNRSTVQTYGIFYKAQEWLQSSVNMYTQTGIKELSKMYLCTIPMLFFSNLPLCTASIAGAMIAFSKHQDISIFITSFTIARYATNELLELPTCLVNLHANRASVQRIFEILDEKVERDSGQINGLCYEETVLQFNDVNFSYTLEDGEYKKILDGISFELKRGEKVAIVGPSGCGKSTLLKLAASLYFPDSGCIKAWGTNIEEWNLKALRKKIAYVSQDTFLLSDSIKNNMIFACADASDHMLEEALNFAELSEYIESLPEKWNTQIVEMGTNLSGGQRQRMAIARMFLQDSSLLLIDEATSALDMNTEANVFKNINNLGKSKTVLIVTHRLSTITDADRVIVLNNGSIVEVGTHEQLLQNNSIYSSLFYQQERGEVES